MITALYQISTFGRDDKP